MSATWALPPLADGEFAPEFVLPSRFNPRFHFRTVAGRYVVLGFLPRDPARQAPALAAWQAQRALFDDAQLTAFFILPEPLNDAAPPDQVPGLRWFFDADGAARKDYRVGDEGAWFLLDPALRFIGRALFEQPHQVFGRLSSLPPVAAHGGVSMVAPVLIVPRVFEPELCRRLIDYYEARGGQPSGVMREIDGKTVGVLDPMKSRRDVSIVEPEFQRELIEAMRRGLIPAIRRGLQFEATRLERYIVACYDAGEGGYFRAHRDNETQGTAHRRFACSINLNAEEFEGGDVRFPEFGPRTYRPPTGGAVVFCCSLLHEATPVTRGRRYAFLPFLYDEAGQAIREKNRALIDNSRAEAALRG